MKLFTRISRLSLLLLSFSIHMQCMENKRQPRALARLAAITSHIKQGVELDEKDFPGEGFAAGTHVHTPTGMMPIQDIARGQEVLSYDRFACKYRKSVVVRRRQKEFEDFTRLCVDGQDIESNGDQRFLDEKSEWRYARNLQPGDHLLTYDLDSLPITKLEKIEQAKILYAISLQGPRNFTIGEQKLLAHNFFFSRELPHIEFIGRRILEKAYAALAIAKPIVQKKVTEKVTAKVAEKAVIKVAEKVTEKVAEKAVEKIAEKTVEKVVGKAAEFTLQKGATTIIGKVAGKFVPYVGQVLMVRDAYQVTKWWFSGDGPGNDGGLGLPTIKGRAIGAINRVSSWWHGYPPSDGSLGTHLPVSTAHKILHRGPPVKSIGGTLGGSLGNALDIAPGHVHQIGGTVIGGSLGSVLEMASKHKQRSPIPQSQGKNPGDRGNSNNGGPKRGSGKDPVGAAVGGVALAAKLAEDAKEETRLVCDQAGRVINEVYVKTGEAVQRAGRVTSDMIEDFSTWKKFDWIASQLRNARDGAYEIIGRINGLPENARFIKADKFHKGEIEVYSDPDTHIGAWVIDKGSTILRWLKPGKIGRELFKKR